jgi:hypothetical protein
VQNRGADLAAGLQLNGKPLPEGPSLTALDCRSLETALVSVADVSYLRDEDALARAGGVTADDRVEVQPWLADEERWSFVTSDPRAIDLACFRGLTRSN